MNKYEEVSIKELMKRKAELENSIKLQLQEFADLTGMKVQGLNIKIQWSESEINKVREVNLKFEL